MIGVKCENWNNREQEFQHWRQIARYLQKRRANSLHASARLWYYRHTDSPSHLQSLSAYHIRSACVQKISASASIENDTVEIDLKYCSRSFEVKLPLLLASISIFWTTRSSNLARTGRKGAEAFYKEIVWHEVSVVWWTFAKTWPPQIRITSASSRFNILL